MMENFFPVIEDLWWQLRQNILPVPSVSSALQFYNTVNPLYNDIRYDDKTCNNEYI